MPLKTRGCLVASDDVEKLRLTGILQHGFQVSSMRVELIVQIHRDCRAGPVPFAGGNDDKAIGARRRKYRCAAQCEWLDLVIGQSNAAVVDPSDRGNDLAGNDTRPRAVWPVRAPSTAEANASPREEVVCAQTRNRIARKQEHKRIADTTHARRARRPHRNAVNRERAGLGEYPRGMILAPDAGAAGDQDDIGVAR